MRPLYTFSEAVEHIEGVTFDQCRKAALVLRALGYPITEQGYMMEDHITFLAVNAERAAAAFDKAEEELHREEKELEGMYVIELPADSEVTSRTIAQRAAETYEMVIP